MNKTLFEQLSLWDVFLFFLVVVTYFFIFMNLHYLPIYNLLINNGDILFIEDIARNLNAGGSLLNWRLTQAPYLFPDIFLTRLLVILPISIGYVAVYYAAIFGLIVMGLIAWLAHITRTIVLTPVLFAAILYSFSYYGILTEDYISGYFAIVGCHAGNIINVLLCLIASALFFEKKWPDSASLALLLVSLFVGTISDSLIIFAFAPFMTLFLLLSVIKKEERSSRAILFFLTMICSVFFGKLYSFIVPFPQDISFFHYVVAQLPGSILPAIRAFAHDFFSYFHKSYISGLIAILYFMSAGLSLYHLSTVIRAKTAVKTPMTLFSLYIIVSPLVVILFQLGLGIYGSISHVRQWAPFIYVAIVLGFMLLTHIAGSRIGVIRIGTVVLTALLLIGLTNLFYRGHRDGKLSVFSPVFSNFIECMKQNHLPQGTYYASDYWPSRPIRLYSHEAFIVQPSNDNFSVWTPGSNVMQDREMEPKFIITGFNIKKSDVIKQFGSPKHIYCEMNVGGWPMAILDYSHNATVTTLLKQKAMQAY